MEHYLKALAGLLPVIWLPALILISLTFTVMAWLLPAWRGNALASVGGFFGSLGGFWLGSLAASTRPTRLAGLLRWVDSQSKELLSPELQGFGAFFFLTIVAGFICYFLGMIFLKLLLRLWHWQRGENYRPDDQRRVLSPFH